MGLPLFVAPVESDIKGRPDKPSAADRAAQTRSAIRRARRSEDREARTLRRRAAILRTHFPTPGPESTRSDARPWDPVAIQPPPPPESARYPWIESGRLPPPEAYQPESVFSPWVPPQRAAAPSSRLNWERIASLFPDWDYAGNRASSHSRPRPAEGRGERPSRTPGREPPAESGDARPRAYRRMNIAPQVAARFDRSPERFTSPGPDSHSYAWRWRDSHGSRAGRPGAVDGLGDRNRSLSPEVWDTLLTTLTPDPQPPSVGSSFASATASGSASASQSQSQNAASSSRTSFNEPAAVDGLEQPCEHGEFSDSENGPNDDMSSVRADHLNVPSRHRRFVSALNAHDGPSTSYVRAEVADRPTLLFNGRPERSQSTGRGQSRAERRQPLRGVRSSRLSGYYSPVEPQETTSFSTTREGSEEPPANPLDLSGSEGDPDLAWEGMQRIVRGLVERRDIPDDWWAEAGLSRMMPGGTS